MGEVIRFDRAEYAGGSAATPCTNCKRPIEQQYWKLQSGVVCGPCRDAITAMLAKANSTSSLGKAALQGGGVALGCGVAYAAFVGVSHLQLALVTIGIAYVIARVVRKASGGVGGRRYQVLAVALTYLASSMGYVPPILKALANHPSATHLLLVLGLALAAPFLELTEAPLGLLIVLFGLWEAWKLSRAAPIVLEGPYSLGPAAEAPPSS